MTGYFFLFTFLLTRKIGWEESIKLIGHYHGNCRMNCGLAVAIPVATVPVDARMSRWRGDGGWHRWNWCLHSVARGSGCMTHGKVAGLLIPHCSQSRCASLPTPSRRVNMCRLEEILAAFESYFKVNYIHHSRKRTLATTIDTSKFSLTKRYVVF